MPANDPTGPEIMEEMAKEPTMDLFYDRAKTDIDYEGLIKMHRMERLAFIQKELEK